MASQDRKRRRKKQKAPKEPFRERLRRQGRETVHLGSTLVNEPRAFPAEVGGLFKRSFRRMWHARGGGFYACGFVLSFAWFEVRTLAGEIVAADGVIAFFTEQLWEFIIRFSVQSITNTVQALVWPALVIGRYELWGIAGLVAGYLLFKHLLKAPLTHWLFDGAPPPGESKQA